MESDEKVHPGFRELTAVLMLVVAVLTCMANKKSADETGRTSQLADKHAKLQTWQQRATLSVSSVQLERMDDRSYLSDQGSRYRLRVRLRNHGEFSAQNVLMVMNADLGRWSGVKELGVLGKGEETELQFVSGRLTEDAKDKMAAFAIAFRDDAYNECVIQKPQIGHFVPVSDGPESKSYDLDFETITDTDMSDDRDTTQVGRAMNEMRRLRRSDCSFRT